MMHRPGGMLFSNLTLAAALWVSYVGQGARLSPQVCGLCAAAYIAGVLGRVFAPTSRVFVRIFQREAPPVEAPPPSEKGTGAAAPEKALAQKAAAQQPEVQKMPKPEDATPGVGARKRVQSPAPRTSRS